MMDFATYRRLEIGERRRIFGTLTPEERAELFRAQIETWLNEHRDQLTAEQVGVMEEHIEFMTADLYRQPRSEELDARRSDLLNRTADLFSFDQMAQALTLQCDDVPQFRDSTIEILDVPLDPSSRIDLQVTTAFAGDTEVDIEIYEGPRLVAKRSALLHVVRGDRPIPLDAPVVQLKDVFSDLARESEERGRIMITPRTRGARIWARALVRGADDIT